MLRLICLNSNRTWISFIAITGEVEITVRGSGGDTESKQSGGKHFTTIGKVTIRESNQALCVRKAHYAKYYV